MSGCGRPRGPSGRIVVIQVAQQRIDRPHDARENYRMGALTEYLTTLDEPARSVIDRFRERTIALVPEAEEGTSYGMAALRYSGRPLVSVVATRAGFSVFPFSSAVVATVLEQLDGFDSTKGGIRFTAKRLLPDDAFDALVTERQAEIDSAR